MARKRLVGSILVLAALVIPAGWAAAAEPSAYLNVLNGASTQIDGKDTAEARIFVNQEKTVLLVCLPGEYAYKIYSKEKTVVALRRPTVMVTPDKCRPMEGAAEQPIAGHLYSGSATGCSFNDLSGRKIVISFPAGTLR